MLDNVTGRRQFLRGATAAAVGLVANRFAPAWGQTQSPAVDPKGFSLLDEPPDYRIEIAEVEWELSPKKKVHTSTYSGQIPAKLLRLSEGRPATIEVVNRLDHAEIVHWHGQWIAPDVDGAMEEGSPMISPGETVRIRFTPKPSGLHWYHTHAMANRDLKRGLYSGQAGPLYVEPRQNPGQYDKEIFLVLQDWDPYYSSSDDGSLMVNYAAASINGRMLGHGDPIRVQSGQRVVFHILNASATEIHWLTLPGHRFRIQALDGRPVPTQAVVEVLRMGPSERVSAVVSMDAPGVWVFGEARADFRNTGMGTVIEYADRIGEPVTSPAPALSWDYRAFADPVAVPYKPDLTLPLVFKSRFQGHGALDKWTINGKSYPENSPIYLQNGRRHRLVFDNRSVDDHPVHLHRHSFELVSIRGKALSGVHKDVVVVEAGSVVEADLVADNPGDTLFHCHQQDHMDSGFMALFRYASPALPPKKEDA